MSDTPTAASTLAHLLTIVKTYTLKEAKACPADKRLHHIAEGKANPLWLIGHLANTAEFFGNSIALNDPSGAIQSGWRKKFTPPAFGGDPISSNAADYASWDEVVAAYTTVFDKLIAGIAKVPDAELTGPPRGKVPEPIKAMAKTLQDAVILNIIHDSHHRGQIALLANAPD